MKNYGSTPLSIFWFRRDLRLHDNHGFLLALKSGLPVLPVFIFDKNILGQLPRHDHRVEFIHRQLRQLNEQLVERGSGLHIEFGQPIEVYRRLFGALKIKSIFFNEDYEPYARQRDEHVSDLAKSQGVMVEACKDQVVFAKNEITKDNGQPYLVYTPYSRRWLAQLTAQSIKPFPSEKNLSRLLQYQPEAIPDLETLGFAVSDFAFPSDQTSVALLKNYAERRDLLAENGTSRLGLHLRFGTVSVRDLVARAQKTSLVFLKELIWREFFMQMLYHFPRTVNEPFDLRYQGMPWRNDKSDFAAWCEGRTGYPVVDAGMRELNATGHMHNRARMVVASFLTKHLLIDWRLGERYFAEKLLDFELSSNVGNWQWAAGCGCDAAPYFRVFNPELQAKKFDPEGRYVRRWVPEVGSASYLHPIVNHEVARQRALATYDQHLKRGNHENSFDRSNRSHR